MNVSIFHNHCFKYKIFLKWKEIIPNTKDQMNALLKLYLIFLKNILLIFNTKESTYSIASLYKNVYLNLFSKHGYYTTGRLNHFLVSQANFAWNLYFIYCFSLFLAFFTFYLLFLQPLKSYIWEISVFDEFFRINSRIRFSEVESSYHVVFRFLIFNTFSPPLSLIMLFLTKT